MTELHLTSKYKPNLKQAKAHLSQVRWLLYGGAFKGGKTRWLVEHVKHLMLTYPGIEGLIGRYDFARLVEPTQVYEMFCNIVEPELINPQLGGEHRRSYPMWMKFINGSRVTFAGLKDFKPGAQYGFVAIDQVEEVKEKDVKLLNSRLAQHLPDGRFPPYQMLLTCNPSPGWLKREFIITSDKDHQFIPALPQDNQANLPANYIEDQRKALSEDDFRRYILGSWDAFVGQALPEFDSLAHIVPYFTQWQDEEWQVWRGIDHGVTAPTVGLWLTKDPHEGDMYFVLEYEATERTAAENAKAIRQMSLGMDITATWIDPRTAAKGGDSKDIEWSVFKEYNRQGIYCTLSQGTRENRFAAWKQALKLDDRRRHPITQAHPAPRLYITQNCMGLIETLPELKYREGVQEHGDDIEKVNDHHYDAGGFVLTGMLNQQSPRPQEKGLTYMQPSGKTRR